MKSGREGRCVWMSQLGVLDWKNAHLRQSRGCLRPRATLSTNMGHRLQIAMHIGTFTARSQTSSTSLLS